jgi:hypothetical protein
MNLKKSMISVENRNKNQRNFESPPYLSDWHGLITARFRELPAEKNISTAGYKGLAKRSCL